MEKSNGGAASPLQHGVMAYNVSKDYLQLFEVIKAGKIVAAFVDYRFRQDDKAPMRDICKVQRLAPYNIRIGVRGMQYGGLDPFNEGEGIEWDLFITECKHLNLEWIEP